MVDSQRKLLAMQKQQIHTQHLKMTGFFHFLKSELIGTIIMFLFATVFVISFASGNGVPVTSIIFVALFVYWPSLVFPILAYKIAKFIISYGYCVLTPDSITSICNGKTKLYSYKNRSISTRKNKNLGVVDIYVGKGLFNFIRFGIGKNFFSSYLAGMGYGAPLYNVTNSEEVLEYISKHN